MPIIEGIKKLGYRLMVGHQVLVLSIEVRVLVPQPIFKRKNRIEISKFQCRYIRKYILLGYRKTTACFS